MPSQGNETRTLAGRKGAAKRWGAPPAQIETLERDHAAARLRDYITAVVDAAPPLTQAQRAELAAILTGGASE